jgi:hypothetical protein
MIDECGNTTSAASFQPFEGMWLATRPAGAVACAKVVNRESLIPYSFGGEGKLTGHYYNCRVAGTTLVSRFEQFDSAVSGVLLLAIAPNETLKGGRWLDEQVPEVVREDIFCLSESLPGMLSTVWIRMSGVETPEWAERYFREPWPNKPSS